jgi:hypothetical protein
MEFSSVIEQIWISIAQSIPNYHLVMLFPIIIFVFATCSSAFEILCSALIPQEQPDKGMNQLNRKGLNKEEADELYAAWQKRIQRGE